MKNSIYNSDYVLPVALLMSAGIHVTVIAATGSSPFTTNASVRQGPNSIEINVIAQPVVSVLEDQIVSQDIAPEVAPSQDDIVFSDTAKPTQPKIPVVQNEASREVRGAITEAKPLMEANPAPLYPKIARQKGWEGTVKLTALIEKDGSPHQVGVAESSGYGILDKAAVNTVKSWKFTPAQSGNSRFSSKITIPIRFDLIKKP